MSLLFKGKNGAVEQRWIIYALLRDNIQHHLEGGKPSAEFAAVHSITDALGGKPIKIDASTLHRELLRAKDDLIGRPMEELAISVRTLAVIHLLWPPPDERETMLVRAQNSIIPFLDIHGETLHDVFGLLLDELLQISKGASDADVVEVVDL